MKRRIFTIFLSFLLLASLNLCGIENAFASSLNKQHISTEKSCHNSTNPDKSSKPSHRESVCCHSMIANQTKVFDQESIGRFEETKIFSYSKILIAHPADAYGKRPTGYRYRSDQILSPKDYFHLAFSIHSPPSYA